MLPQHRPDFHELKAHLDLLHEHVHLDGADRQAEVLLERREQVVPHDRILDVLYLRQVERERGASAAEHLVVVDDEGGEVGRGRRVAGAVRVLDVAVVQVKAARPEHLGREVELLLPVGDGAAAEEAFRPPVHFIRHLLGRAHEDRVAGEGELQVPLVVERHRPDLAERVLAVEHPAVGAREQRVRDVADAGLDRGVWPGGGSGPLDPLALEVVRDLAPLEVAGPRVRDADGGARDDRTRIEEPDWLPVARTGGAPPDAGGHRSLPLDLERRQDFKGGKHLWRVDIVVDTREIAADTDLAHRASPSIGKTEYTSISTGSGLRAPDFGGASVGRVFRPGIEAGPKASPSATCLRLYFWLSRRSARVGLKTPQTQNRAM